MVLASFVYSVYTLVIEVDNRKGVYTVKKIRSRNESTLIRVDLASKKRLVFLADKLRESGRNITLTTLASQIIMQADLPTLEK